MREISKQGVSRRNVLKGAGAATAAGMSGLAGCSSGDQGDNDATTTSNDSNGGDQTTTQAQQSFDDFTVGCPDGGIKAADIPYFWAIREQLPTQAGYRGSIKYFEGANITGQAFAAGGIDMAFINPGVVASMAQAGNDVTIFGTEYAGTDYVFVMNTDLASSLDDFVNSDIAVGMSGPGGNSQLQPAVMFREKGYNLDNVTFQRVGGSSTRTKAVAAGQIAGVVIHYDQWLSIKDEPSVKQEGAMKDLIGGWVGESLFASTKKLEENPQWAVNQLKPTITAFEKARNDFDWYYKYFQKYYAQQFTEEEVKGLWEFNNEVAGTWAENNMDKSIYEKFLGTYQSLGLLPDDFTVDSVWTDKYYKMALDSL